MVYMIPNYLNLYKGVLILILYTALNALNLNSDSEILTTIQISVIIMTVTK
jgi:hypothetical protein